MSARIRLSILALAILSGCGGGDRAAQEASTRNIVAGERHYQAAIAAIDAQDYEEAERHLRDALAADLYHGPAHNNLGIIHLMQGRLYEAAEEFEWARKLLPGHPEPRVNLALVLERGGRRQEAFDAAVAALEARPGHLQAIQMRAWLAHQEGIVYPEFKADLDAIAIRASEDQWREWAGLERLRLDPSGERR